jgi:hypothetical protein
MIMSKKINFEETGKKFDTKIVLFGLTFYKSSTTACRTMTDYFLKWGAVTLSRFKRGDIKHDLKFHIINCAKDVISLQH